MCIYPVLKNNHLKSYIKFTFNSNKDSITDGWFKIVYCLEVFYYQKHGPEKIILQNWKCSKDIILTFFSIFSFQIQAPC